MQERSCYPQRSPRRKVQAVIYSKPGDGVGEKPSKMMREERAHGLWRQECGVKNHFCNVKWNKKDKI